VQVAQGLEHVLGTLIAPYGQFRGLTTPGSSKGTWKQELRARSIQRADCEQLAGQRYGEWFAKREEMKRAQRSRGPVDYLGRRLQSYEARP
jgi:hypothetical protein